MDILRNRANTYLRETFTGIDADLLQSLSQKFDFRRYGPSETVVSQGSPDRDVYLHLSGLLLASITTDSGEDEIVGEITPGEVFGEMNFFTGTKRTATVISIRDSWVVRIGEADFDQLLKSAPTVQPIVKTVVERLEKQTKHAKRIATVALFPMTTGNPTAFVNTLSEVLVRSCTAKVLREEELSKHASEQELLIWLSNLEIENDLLIYAAQTQASPWWTYCLRQADLLLLIANADIPAKDLQRNYASLQATHPFQKAELVLLHEGGTKPQGTARLLRHTPFVRHHHLQPGEVKSSAKMARYITGQSINLVLSGGGALCFSYIGALRAFEEARVPIDSIGGTSMGSIVAAMHAQGLNSHEIEERLTEGMKHKPFTGLTIPFVSATNGHRLYRMLRHLFANVQIEDLWVEYFCISCNLTKGEVTCHKEGPLWKWVKASNTVPGIIPPLFDEEHIYIDGGVINNFPVDVMRRNTNGLIIGLDAQSRTREAFTPYSNQKLSGWSILFERLNPFKSHSDFPMLGQMLVRTMLLGSSNHAKAVASLADFRIAMPVTDYVVSDWSALPALVDIGYHTTLAELQAWNIST